MNLTMPTENLQKQQHGKPTRVGPKVSGLINFLRFTEIKQHGYFSIQSPFISKHADTDTVTSP